MTRLLLVLATALLALSCNTTPRPLGKEAAEALLGTRPVSLQWVSWDEFGEAEVTKDGDRYFLKGLQQNKAGDTLTLDGELLKVTDLGFILEGRIVTKVSHLNGGKPYVREGQLPFFRYPNRRFWRLGDMAGPNGVTDYIDLYEDLEAAKSEGDY